MTRVIKLKYNQPAKIAPKHNTSAFKITSQGTAYISVLIQRPSCIRCLFSKSLDRIHYDVPPTSKFFFQDQDHITLFICTTSTFISMPIKLRHHSGISPAPLSFWVWGKRNLGNYTRHGQLKVAPQMMSHGAQGIGRSNTGRSIRSQSSHTAQVRLGGIPV